MYNSKTQTFTDISSLREVGGANQSIVFVLGYYDPNDGGGGYFIYDSDSTEDDNNGTIIQPDVISGAGRWKRIITDGVYNLKWFGAKTDGSDCIAAFNSLNDAIPGVGSGNANSVMVIPSGTYTFNSTITPTKKYDIIGLGGGTYVSMGTKLSFPSNVGGILLTRENGVDNVKIKNIHFKGLTTGQNSAHGLSTNCRLIVDNIACQGFGGNGVNIDTSSTGIADSASYSNMTLIENLGNGLYVAGNDSNNIIFKNIFTNANGKSNIYDNSFLGNNYINGHSAFSGMIVGSQSWVSHNGTYYVAIYPPSHTNIEPGVTSGWESYWQHFDGVEDGNVPQPWDSATVYYCSRAYALVGANNYGQMTGFYTEGGQARGMLAGYSQAYGGTPGAGVDDNACFMSKSDGKFMSYGTIQVPITADRTSVTELSTLLGLFIGDTEGSLQVIAGGDGTVRAYTNGTLGDVGFMWMGGNFDKTKVGRSANIAQALPIITKYGMFFADDLSLTNLRSFSGGASAPSDGEWGVGDFRWNTGSDATISGWRCTSGGTPGTWQTEYVNLTPPS